jgi:orotidine-5'-phosphate decarboxylase
VKRSDIGETQKRYAKAYFETLRVDAVTLNPLLGFDTLEPFLAYEDKGIYLLAVTSNPGAEELLRAPMGDGRELHQHIQDYALRAADHPADVGLVMGLTNLSDELLGQVADLPLLVPGLGAQGGDLRRLEASGRRAPMLVNVSRGIQYREPERNYADKAADWAAQLRGLVPAP